jgi:hypothetical protein
LEQINPASEILFKEIPVEILIEPKIEGEERFIVEVTFSKGVEEGEIGIYCVLYRTKMS